jgi:ATP-dependent DNA helicase RecG
LTAIQGAALSAVPQEQSLHETPVTDLKGIGPRNAARLAKIGVTSVQDVLFHLPLRYQDRTRVQAIGSLRPGDQVVVEGQVEAAEIRFGRRRSLLVVLADGTGSLTLRFFHFSAAQREALNSGVVLRCFGEVRKGPAGLEMIHPEYSRETAETPTPVEVSLTPVYPSTEGMHQLSWRGITDKALALLAQQPERLPEWLPPSILQRYRLPDLAQAVRFLHRPPADTPLDLLSTGGHPAQRRLVFEELLAHRLSLGLLRRQRRQVAAVALMGDGGLRGRFMRRLGYTLTAAQQRVGTEIATDLAAGRPMMRLLQGDVGSGKTVVAAMAALQALEAGTQVALMAPTELLSEQHFRTFREWLEPLGLAVHWLTGRLKGRVRNELLATLAEGGPAVVAGTQALFQQDVVFGRLGLVIIDEQHRFGVHQRMALREKGRSGRAVPHQLIMTATPIPRTLAMSAYADLDLSVIDELPAGRKPVSTVVVPAARRQAVIERVRAACAEGRQAYWVCTLIEESEALQCEAAEESARQLTELLPELRVGLVHGRLKAVDKAAAMQAFQDRALDLLVATTVIEVGVDVPNASLMIIENPERLGLAQLHQLRGRVGRGSTESHCVLMYQTPLSGNAQQRLAVMRESSDGFLIAQKDLELRGAGEVLGTRQTGEMQFRIADLVRDQAVLDDVAAAADQLLQEFPERVPQLVKRWVGVRQQYIHA